MLLIDGLPAKHGARAHGKTGRRAGPKVIRDQVCQQGRLFMMREWLELDTEEVCKALAISPTNLWVMLHRARLRLRECMQMNWFSAEGKMS